MIIDPSVSKNSLNDIFRKNKKTRNYFMGDIC